MISRRDFLSSVGGLSAYSLANNEPIVDRHKHSMLMRSLNTLPSGLSLLFKYITPDIDKQKFIINQKEANRNNLNINSYIEKLNKVRTVSVRLDGMAKIMSDKNVNNMLASDSVPMSTELHDSRGIHNYVVLYGRLNSEWLIISQTPILNKRNSIVQLENVEHKIGERFRPGVESYEFDNSIRCSKRVYSYNGEVRVFYRVSEPSFRSHQLTVSLASTIFEYHKTLSGGITTYTNQYSKSVNSLFVERLAKKIRESYNVHRQNISTFKMSMIDVISLISIAQDYSVDKWPPENPKTPAESVFSFSDCEDIAILACSLIEKLTDYTPVLLAFPGHMEFGYQGPAEELNVFETRRITVNGQKYVYPYSEEYNSNFVKDNNVIAVGDTSGWVII